VLVGPGHCSAIDTQHERQVIVLGVWCGAGDVCQHAHTFVAHPSARPAADQVIHKCGECRPVLLVEVGDNGAVKHHDHAMLGRGVDLRRQRFEQVPCRQGGRILAGDGDRVDQSWAPLFLFRPDQCPQPSDGILIGDVERVQLDPASPADSQRCCRHRHGAGNIAAQFGAAAAGQATDWLPVIVVSVGIEAQAGACPDLEEGEWLLIRASVRVWKVAVDWVIHLCWTWTFRELWRYVSRDEFQVMTDTGNVEDSPILVDQGKGGHEQAHI
jgi:hypothetical protein